VLCYFLSFLVFGKFFLPRSKKSSMMVACHDSEQLLCAPIMYEEHFYCFRKGEEIHDWRIGNVVPIYKKGWKEDPGNYRCDLGAREDYGAVHTECTHRACEGQLGDQAQPAWVHERHVLLDQPDLLL